MSDSPISDIDFKDKMAWVWNTLQLDQVKTWTWRRRMFLNRNSFHNRGEIKSKIINARADFPNLPSRLNNSKTFSDSFFSPNKPRFNKTLVIISKSSLFLFQGSLDDPSAVGWIPRNSKIFIFKPKLSFLRENDNKGKFYIWILKFREFNLVIIYVIFNKKMANLGSKIKFGNFTEFTLHTIFTILLKMTISIMTIFVKSKKVI